MHVQLWKSKDGWRIRLVSSNGQILTSSEAYYSKWNAKRAAKRVFPTLQIKET